MRHKIEPSQKELRREFDYDPDRGILIHKRRTGRRPAEMYFGRSRRISYNGELYSMARLVFIWHNGPIQGYIRRKNHVLSDSHIENLRDMPATNIYQHQPPRATNSSGIVGVCAPPSLNTSRNTFTKTRWVASITHNKQFITLYKGTSKLEAVLHRWHAECHFNKTSKASTAYRFLGLNKALPKQFQKSFRALEVSAI
jgi:hypothetical protein